VRRPEQHEQHEAHRERRHTAQRIAQFGDRVGQVVEEDHQQRQRESECGVDERLQPRHLLAAQAEPMLHRQLRQVHASLP
jgi:hypothetical protein